MEISVKRNAALTLSMLAGGVDPGTLPPGTLPANFRQKNATMTALDDGEDEEEYVPSPEHPDDSYYEVDATGEETSFGMKVNGVEVTSLQRGGWAMKGGVLLDDEVFAVDNIPFAPLSRAEKAMTLLANRPMTIKFKRPIIKDT